MKSTERNFRKLMSEDRILLGVTNSSFIINFNGRSSFMKGIVKEPGVEEVVDEMEKMLVIAKQSGFCDIAIFWPTQYICISTPQTKTKIIEARQLPLLRISEICGRLKIFFSFIYAEELVELNKTLVKEIQKKSRGYFLGECLGEVGGRTWYCKERVDEKNHQQEKNRPDFVRYKWYARDMQEAKDNYVDYIRRRVTKYKEMGCPFSFSVDSTAMQKYNLEGGVDFAGVEVCSRMGISLALTRGASQSYGREFWCVYIPLGYYWGWPHNTVDKLKRWGVALDLSFMMGANIIINENGLFSTQINTPSLTSGLPAGVHSFKSSFCTQSRKIFQDFAFFTRLQQRPKCCPEANIGVVQGNLDAWNNCFVDGQTVWAQHKGKQWDWGTAEACWKFLEIFFPGEYWFSGTPYGQVDIISSDAPVSTMAQYKTLIFLGWNTMTIDLLMRLKKYVEGGGNLFLSLPHLNMEPDRKKNLKLINKKFQKKIFGLEILGKAGLIKRIKMKDGKVISGMKKEYIFSNSKICGVETKSCGAEIIACSGHLPVLMTNNLGKGKIYLLLSWNYPGEKEWEEFMIDFLCSLGNDVLENQEIKVQGGATLNYAIYPSDGKRPKTLYLLEYAHQIDKCPKNKTKFFPVLSKKPSQTLQQCIVKTENEEFFLKLRPNELRMVYFLEDMAVSPSSKFVFLKSHSFKDNRYILSFQGRGYSEIEFISFKNKINEVRDEKGILLFRNKRKNNSVKCIICLEPDKAYDLTVLMLCSPFTLL